jgi:hypothetical protein
LKTREETEAEAERSYVAQSDRYLASARGDVVLESVSELLRGALSDGRLFQRLVVQVEIVRHGDDGKKKSKGAYQRQQHGADGVPLRVTSHGPRNRQHEGGNRNGNPGAIEDLFHALDAPYERGGVSLKRLRPEPKIALDDSESLFDFCQAT